MHFCMSRFIDGSNKWPSLFGIISNKGDLGKVHITLISSSTNIWKNTQEILNEIVISKYQIDDISTAHNLTTFLQSQFLILFLFSLLSLSLPFSLSTREYLNMFIFLRYALSQLVTLLLPLKHPVNLHLYPHTFFRLLWINYPCFDIGLDLLPGQKIPALPSSSSILVLAPISLHHQFSYLYWIVTINPQIFNTFSHLRKAKTLPSI